MYIMSLTLVHEQSCMETQAALSNRGFPNRALQEGVLIMLFQDKDRQKQLLASLDSSLKGRYLCLSS